MFIARIDGCITSTAKHRSISGFPLLIAQRIDADGRPAGEPQLVIDPIGASFGTYVMVSTDGDHARRLLNDNCTPARLVVLGILDAVQTREGRTFPCVSASFEAR